MGILLDWYMRWKAPETPVAAAPPAKPNAKTFIIVGDFWKAWQSGKATGKINGLPCTIYYKADVVTIVLKEAA